jgi:hypothetical protein
MVPNRPSGGLGAGGVAVGGNADLDRTARWYHSKIYNIYLVAVGHGSGSYKRGDAL